MANHRDYAWTLHSDRPTRPINPRNQLDTAAMVAWFMSAVNAMIAEDVAITVRIEGEALPLVSVIGVPK